MSPTLERLVIVNTSPLLYLYLIDHLHLLHKLYGRIVVPPGVVQELRAGAEMGLDVPNPATMTWVTIRPLQSNALIPAITDLGHGEAEVIGLGLENPASLLILDDDLARRVAEVCKLTYTGTLGVLLKAKREGHLAAVRPVIQDLRNAGLWLADDLVAMVLRKAGEV